MKAIYFKAANKVLVAPDCFDLPVLVEPESVTSAWQIEPEDIEALKASGGILYLTIVTAAGTQPPVRIATSL